MRRGLAHVVAWLLATGAAVTLSWWGVHTVLTGTAYDPPRAVPLTVGDASARESRSLPSAPGGPSSSPTLAPPPAATPSPRPSRTHAAATPSKSASSGTVRSYDTDGGRVVLDLGKTSATLVSATPGAGWSVRVWKTESWIRVEFASGADRVTVFCTWHDGPPRVETF